jgi:pantetheine-phosphate adenylyltransferase
MSPPIAVYAGSFDPPTKGHIDIMERAARLFGGVIVAIGVHPTRRPLFSADERVALLRQITAGMSNVEVQTFSGLLVQHCRSVGAKVIVRGLRVMTDFEYELQIAHGNADLAPELETVFLPTHTHQSFISASLVREIASHGGDVSRYAVPVVCEALRGKFAKAEGPG